MDKVDLELTGWSVAESWYLLHYLDLKINFEQQNEEMQLAGKHNNTFNLWYIEGNRDDYA